MYTSDRVVACGTGDHSEQLQGLDIAVHYRYQILLQERHQRLQGTSIRYSKIVCNQEFSSYQTLPSEAWRNKEVELVCERVLESLVSNINSIAPGASVKPPEIAWRRYHLPNGIPAYQAHLLIDELGCGYLGDDKEEIVELISRLFADAWEYIGVTDNVAISSYFETRETLGVLPYWVFNIAR